MSPLGGRDGHAGRRHVRMEGGEGGGRQRDRASGPVGEVSFCIVDEDAWNNAKEYESGRPSDGAREEELGATGGETDERARKGGE